MIIIEQRILYHENLKSLQSAEYANFYQSFTKFVERHSLLEPACDARPDRAGR